MCFISMFFVVPLSSTPVWCGGSVTGKEKQRLGVTNELPSPLLSFFFLYCLSASQSFSLLLHRAFAPLNGQDLLRPLHARNQSLVPLISCEDLLLLVWWNSPCPFPRLIFHLDSSLPSLLRRPLLSDQDPHVLQGWVVKRKTRITSSGRYGRVGISMSTKGLSEAQEQRDALATMPATRVIIIVRHARFMDFSKALDLSSTRAYGVWRNLCSYLSGPKRCSCPYCGARFVPAVEGHLCSVCELTVIGADASDLVCSPTQSR